MTAAPYTPGTLARIRQGAGASQLGWSSERFNSVCRKHGIERITPTPVKIAAIVPRPMSAAQAKRDPKPPEGKRGPRISLPVPTSIPAGEPSFDERHAIFRVGVYGVRFGGVIQERIFALLFDRFTLEATNTVHGEDLAAHARTTRGSIAGSVSSMNRKLRPLGFCIEGRMGPHGGYLLTRVERP